MATLLLWGHAEKQDLKFQQNALQVDAPNCHLLFHQQLDPRCYFCSAANNSNNPILARTGCLVSSLMGKFQVQPDLVQCQQVSVEIRQIHFSDPEYE